jgi:cell division protein FtsW
MKKNFENMEHEAPKSVPSILTKHRLLSGDRVLWVIVTLFFAISLVAVYTASSQYGLREGTLNTELQRHITTLGLSAIILIFCYRLGASLLCKVSLFAYSSAWVATLLPYIIGTTRNEAHRWLDLGFFEFQPSELLKIGTVMLLAVQLSARHRRIGTLRLLPTTFDVRKWKTPKELEIFKNDIVPVVLPIALSCIVILPAHTSSAVHIFFVSLVLLFIAGVRFKEIAKLFAVAVFCGMIALFALGRWGVFVDRMTARFKSSTKTEKVEKQGSKKKNESSSAKDTYYSKMAIQNGGVFGVGAGRSMMRAKLTHPESDYLFAVIAEEFGLLLSFVIVLLYLWLFFRSLRIFEKCEWLFGGLLAVGLAFLITSQGFLHIGVALGILPETGQNLPFITHGRTGMFCASIAVGLILSISRQVEQGTLLPPSQKGNSQI